MYTVRETACRLRVSSATVYALIASGKLACHRVGVGRGVIRVGEEQIHAYLAACQCAPSAASSPVPPRPRLKHIRL